MIRNPSDGTTYELPKPQVSGLPELETEMGNPKSKDEIARLERSREWLKNNARDKPGHG
jgi:hypothetical protein